MCACSDVDCICLAHCHLMLVSCFAAGTYSGMLFSWRGGVREGVPIPCELKLEGLFIIAHSFFVCLHLCDQQILKCVLVFVFGSM